MTQSLFTARLRELGRSLSGDERRLLYDAAQEIHRLREALTLIADIDPITDKHAPVQMRNVQRLAKEALGV